MIDDLVRNYLSYDPLTGNITWAKPPSRQVSAGDSAGRDNGHGYLQILLRGNVLQAHRVAWFLSCGEWPGNTIDHINSIRSDNRIENLRAATYQENNRYSGIRKNNTSGYKGVYRPKGSNRWAARIMVDRKNKFLGSFDLATDAAIAYNIYAVCLFGEFAILNDIKGSHENN